MLSMGAISFLLEQVPFQKGSGLQEKKNKKKHAVTKIASLVKNLYPLH